MEPGIDRARLADDGRRAARKLYVDGLAGSEIDDPLEEAFADAAVEEFSRLQREETPGIYREATTCRPLPSAFMTAIPAPERASRMNAIFAPSGDHVGR